MGPMLALEFAHSGAPHSTWMILLTSSSSCSSFSSGNFAVAVADVVSESAPKYHSFQPSGESV